MKRTTIFLPVPMVRQLKVVCKRAGIPMSEVIRAAITAHLNQLKKAAA
jgi:predicted DNA-binding protein